MAADLIDLIGRVALGDRAAFRALYDATQAHLFPLVRRITGNPATAAEVLQDSYMAVWHRASTFDPARAGVMTWMTTIFRNRAFDRIGLASARHETALADGDDIDALWESRESGADASAWMDAEDQRRRLADCMGHLEARQRQSVALAYLQGMSHSEVAEHLNLPLGSVKGWIRRALVHLKDCVGAP